MSEPNELQAVARVLQSLAPNPGSLDRDRLMFEAGRQSARPARLWAATTLLSTACAAILAGVIVLRPLPEPVVRVVEVRVPIQDPTTPATDQPPIGAQDIPRLASEGTHNYGRLQDHILRWGLDMPASPPLPEGPPMALAMRIERGEPRTFGLFTSWLLSGGKNQ